MLYKTLADKKKSKRRTAVNLTAVNNPRPDNPFEGLDEKAAYDLVKAAIEGYNATMPSHKRVIKVNIRKEPFEKTTSQKIKRKYN